jgi:phosphoribosylformimino-5-aminoimidazole carboxamide ribotide isomerase
MTGFTIIPVLDLKHGVVVRARAGDRANYHPIVSSLSTDSAPVNVLRGLLGLASFPVVYIADLDAIAREGDHRAALSALIDANPGIAFWLDGGFTTLESAGPALRPGVVPVFGSETVVDAEALAAMLGTLGADGFILSLDYRGDEFLGDPGIVRRIELWPNRLILMTLDRVGTAGGPDVEALGRLRRLAVPRAIFAAGGVRDESDIVVLKEKGVAGALVATALHDGRLSAASLARHCL